MTGGGPFLLIRFATTMEHVVLDALVPTRELASLFREPPRKGFQIYRYGRGNGVGRGRGVGVGLPTGVGVAVGVGDGVRVGVGVGVTVGVTVGVG